MSKTIVLIGLSGCGKSTYGHYLAEKLGREFFDTDLIIESREGRPISEIFSQFGESYFRDLEWTVFNELLPLENVIIATGGGLVPTAVKNGLDKPKGAFMLYLDTDPTEILHRLEDPNNLSERPLLAAATDLQLKVFSMYEERTPAYKSWADGTVKNIHMPRG